MSSWDIPIGANIVYKSSKKINYFFQLSKDFFNIKREMMVGDYRAGKSEIDPELSYMIGLVYRM
jgi:hypothetical protein